MIRELTDDEREFLFELSAIILGGASDPQHRPEIILSNVRNRVRVRRCKNLRSYLNLISQDEQEFAYFVSSLTIHTTGWFREQPHYEWFERKLRDELERQPNYQLRILSAACSTGEEVYSFAAICQQLRSEYPLFSYQVFGLDIDPICIGAARGAIYPVQSLKSLPSRYRELVEGMSVKLSGGDFRLKRDLTDNCHFQVGNIKKPVMFPGNFDIITCRNVLIYFGANDVRTCLERLCTRLNHHGHLVLGHSEAIDAPTYGLETITGTVYRKKRSPNGKAISVPISKSEAKSEFDLILMGASTGGPQVLTSLLEGLGPRLPPVLVVQHISGQFHQQFAERLTQMGGFQKVSMRGGEALRSGCLYVPQGDYHIGVNQVDGKLCLKKSDEAALAGHRPSVEYLFQTAARLQGVRIMAAILTGMGSDGAQGLMQLHLAGAKTFCQDFKSCVVDSMPREARRLCDAHLLVHPDELRQLLEMQALEPTRFYRAF